MGYSPWSCKESGMTERLTLSFSPKGIFLILVRINIYIINNNYI